MSGHDCDAVAPLLDLYAAGECAPDEEVAVRAHLAECPACMDVVADARRLQGLLDVQFGLPDALSRLGKKVEAEARRGQLAPRILPFRRYAAIAALLLVTLGLGLLLGPTAPSTSGGLLLALAELPGRGHPPAPARMPEKMLEWDAPQVLADRAGRWPLPPRVDMLIAVQNPGPKAVELEVGGSGFRCEVVLEGIASVRQHAPARPGHVPFPLATHRIEPGGNLELRLERLAAQVGDRVTYLYPTVPGDYVLRVRLEAFARRGGVREKVRLEAPPWRLRLR